MPFSSCCDAVAASPLIPPVSKPPMPAACRPLLLLGTASGSAEGGRAAGASPGEPLAIYTYAPPAARRFPPGPPASACPGIHPACLPSSPQHAWLLKTARCKRLLWPATNMACAVPCLLLPLTPACLLVHSSLTRANACLRACSALPITATICCYAILCNRSPVPLYRAAGRRQTWRHRFEHNTTPASILPVPYALSWLALLLLCLLPTVSPISHGTGQDPPRHCHASATFVTRW